MPFPVMPPPRLPRQQRITEALAPTGFTLVKEEWSPRYDTGKLIIRSPEGGEMVVEAWGDVTGLAGAEVISYDHLLDDDAAQGRRIAVHHAIEQALIHPNRDVLALFLRERTLGVWNVYSELPSDSHKGGWLLLRTITAQPLQFAVTNLLHFAGIPDWRRSYLAHYNDPTAATTVPAGAISHRIWREENQ